MSVHEHIKQPRKSWRDIPEQLAMFRVSRLKPNDSCSVFIDNPNIEVALLWTYDDDSETGVLEYVVRVNNCPVYQCANIKTAVKYSLHLRQRGLIVWDSRKALDLSFIENIAPEAKTS